jgi:hypothetical protein
MVVTLYGTSSTNLWFLALKGFVISYFLAVVALVWSQSALKRGCLTRQSSSIKVPFAQESGCFGCFLKVNYHGTMFLQ